MKKFGSKLFEKFEDKKIATQTAQKINGGRLSSGTDATLDPTGGNADCNDVYTDQCCDTYPNK